MPQANPFRPWRRSHAEDPRSWAFGSWHRDRSSMWHHRDRLAALAAAGRRVPAGAPLRPFPDERVGSGRNVALIGPTDGRRPAGGSPPPGEQRAA